MNNIEFKKLDNLLVTEVEQYKSVKDTLKESSIISLYETTQLIDKEARKIALCITNEDSETYEDACKNTDVNIELNGGCVVVELPPLLHRKAILKKRISFEKSIINEVGNYVKKYDINAIKKCVIVFEHTYPSNYNKERIYDNDNYNTSEVKQILDAIVTSNIIDNDSGESCSIMHLTTIKDTRKTKVHIIPREFFSTYYKLYFLTD